MAAKKKAKVAESPWPASEIVQRALADLRAFERNPRTHTDQQVEQIAASIDEWGWTSPILIDEEDEIVAGHGRAAAAKLLGIPTVPCIVARGWSREQKRAYVIADNQLAINAGWDEELLRAEMQLLSDDAFDLQLIGFPDDELERLVQQFDVQLAADGPDLISDEDPLPIQQMTFTLHEDQVPVIDAAVRARIKQGGSEHPGNSNSRGCALAAICEEFLRDG